MVVQDLIAGGDVLNRIDCNLVPNMQVELSNGIRGRTIAKGTHIFLRTPESTMVAGIDGSGVSNWLEMKFPDLFMPSVKLSHHDNPDCLKAISFYNLRDSFSLSRGLSKKAKDLVNIIPSFLRLMESLHSTGLLVPWEEVDISEDYTFRLISRSAEKGASWTLLVNPDGQVSDQSRMNDLMTLADMLTKLGPVPDLPDFAATLMALRGYIETLDPSEIPDYQYWMTEFSTLRFVGAGERFAELQPDDFDGICEIARQDWNPWIESIMKAKPANVWEALGGSRLVSAIPHIVENAHCRMNLMGLVTRAIRSHIHGMNAVDQTLFIHRVFRGWDSSGFCRAHWPVMDSEVTDILRGVPFGWIICPEEQIILNARASLILKRANEVIFNSEITVSRESVFDLLHVLELHRVIAVNPSTAKDALKFLSGLLRNRGFNVHDIASVMRAALPGDYVNQICTGYTQVASDLIHEDLGTINLAWLCDPPSTAAKLCSLVEGYGDVRNIKTPIRPISDFEAEGFRDVSLLATNRDVSEHCRNNAVRITVEYVTGHMLIFVDDNGSRILPHAVLMQFPTLHTIFSWNLRSLGPLNIRLLLLAWMTGNAPELINSFLHSAGHVSEASSGLAAALFVPDTLTVEEWAADIRGSQLLEGPRSCREESCKTRVAKYIVGVLAHAPAGVIHLLDGREEFCYNNRRFIRRDPSPAIQTALATVCPGSSAIADLRQDIAQARSNLGGGRLEVHRGSAFSDSLPLLSSQFVNEEKPRGVGFIGEMGVDQGGITRDWFSVVGQLVSGVCVGDQNGGLFVRENGKDYFVIDKLRTQTDGDLKAWFAFGRLMALALSKHAQIGIPLPVYFFGRFLKGRVDEEDYKPEIADTIRSYQDILTYPPSAFSVPWLLPIPELGDDEIEVTDANREQVVASAIATYSSGPDEPAFEQMRAGFSEFHDLHVLRELITAAELKSLISGDDTLNVPGLKAIAVKADAVSMELFNLLFEWLSNADTETQHKFMHFVTGSPSFSVRKLMVNARDAGPRELPLAHTCFGGIDLPRYTNMEELAAGMAEAIVSTDFGIA